MRLCEKNYGNGNHEDGQLQLGLLRFVFHCILPKAGLIRDWNHYWPCLWIISGFAPATSGHPPPRYFAQSEQLLKDFRQLCPLLIYNHYHYSILTIQFSHMCSVLCYIEGLFMYSHNNCSMCLVLYQAEALLS